QQRKPANIYFALALSHYLLRPDRVRGERHVTRLISGITRIIRFRSPVGAAPRRLYVRRMIGIWRRSYWRQQIRVGLKWIIGADWDVGQLRSGHRPWRRIRLLIFRHDILQK